MNHHKFYFTLYDYLYDIENLPSNIVDELKKLFYIQKTEFGNLNVLYVYYFNETKLIKYGTVLKTLALYLGCAEMILVDVSIEDNLEIIKQNSYKTYLEILYLKTE